jgi:hypothetical protein
MSLFGEAIQIESHTSLSESQMLPNEFIDRADVMSEKWSAIGLIVFCFFKLWRGMWIIGLLNVFTSATVYRYAYTSLSDQIWKDKNKLSNSPDKIVEHLHNPWHLQHCFRSKVSLMSLLSLCSAHQLDSFDAWLIIFCIEEEPQMEPTKTFGVVVRG